MGSVIYGWDKFIIGVLKKIEQEESRSVMEPLLFNDFERRRNGQAEIFLNSQPTTIHFDPSDIDEALELVHTCPNCGNLIKNGHIAVPIGINEGRIVCNHLPGVAFDRVNEELEPLCNCSD